MKISVIIPTKDRPSDLEQTLRSILTQSRRPDELIIIDDGHLEQTFLDKILGNRLTCQYFCKARPGLVLSRLKGLELATGDIISFLDDDVKLDARYFAEIEQVFAQDSAGKISAVGGFIELEDKQKLRPIKKTLESFFLQRGPAGSVLPTTANTFVEERPINDLSVDWLPGCNMNFRRAVFERERFDSWFTEYGLGEDLEFTYRLKTKGHKLVITPRATLKHYFSPTSRLKQKQLGYMIVRNHRYIFKKLLPQTEVNKIKFGWYLFGWLFIEALNKLADPARDRGGRIFGLLRGIWE